MPPLAEEIFEATEWGPFDTEFHKQLVDDRFKTSVLPVIEKEIAPRLTFGEPEQIAGLLYTDYDEERHLGPRSLCKYYFVLKCGLFTDEACEHAYAEVVYDPESGTMRFKTPNGVDIDTESREHAERMVAGVKCPCCGFPELSMRIGYEICGICNWEDDGQDDEDANEVRGGPNHDYSLTEARANFLRHGSMYREGDIPRGMKRDMLWIGRLADLYRQLEAESDRIRRFALAMKIRAVRNLV